MKAASKHNLGCGLMLGFVALFFGEFLFVCPLASLLRYGHWESLPGQRGKTSYSFIFDVDGVHLWLALLTFITGILLYRAWESQWWRYKNPLNARAVGLPTADNTAQLAAALENSNKRLLVEFESAEESRRKPPNLLGRLLLIPVLFFIAGKIADLFGLGQGERTLLAISCTALPAVVIYKALQAVGDRSAPDHRQLVDLSCGELYQLDCNSNAAPVLLAKFSDFTSIEVKRYEPDVLVCIIRYKVLLLGLEDPIEFGPRALEPKSANLVAERLSRLLNLPCQKAPEPEELS